MMKFWYLFVRISDTKSLSLARHRLQEFCQKYMYPDFRQLLKNQKFESFGCLKPGLVQISDAYCNLICFCLLIRSRFFELTSKNFKNFTIKSVKVRKISDKKIISNCWILSLGDQIALGFLIGVNQMKSD